MDHRILLADDNAIVRRVLARTLEAEGYAVVEAGTGKEALAHLDSSIEFDLLLTDLEMPDMDGLQVLTEVKRTDPDLPVIAISGAFSGRLLRFATTFGVPTLEKPFSVPALLQTVESALLSKESSAA
jgi:two-component system, cell cycle sensor histidine kinase and response regulator CckA